MKKRFAWVALLVTVMGCAEQRKPDLNDLPAPAHQTVDRLVGSGTVTRVEVKLKHGATTYHVYWHARDKSWEIIVDPNGIVLKNQRDK